MLSWISISLGTEDISLIVVRKCSLSIWLSCPCCNLIIDTSHQTHWATKRYCLFLAKNIIFFSAYMMTLWSFSKDIVILNTHVLKILLPGWPSYCPYWRAVKETVCGWGRTPRLPTVRGCCYKKLIDFMFDNNTYKYHKTQYYSRWFLCW